MSQIKQQYAHPKQICDLREHPQPRRVRMRGDLPFELLSPPAGNLLMTFRARAIGSDVVFLNEVAVALNEQFATMRAVSVFQIANLSRKVPCVNEIQPGPTSDFGGALQR